MLKKELVLISCLFFMGCASNLKKSAQDNSMSGTILSKETEALFKNLQIISGKGIMFGHQDAVAYGIGWTGGEFDSDVQKVCGSYPAVFGWDIGHIDSLENIDNVPFSDMKRWMVEAYKRGGINTISWHQLNPKTGDSSWDNTSAVSDILPGGNLNDKFIGQLNKVAEFIGSLATNNGARVPVIFRPYHEHNGSWFWWGSGSCSDDLYIKLFRYTVDYLKETKSLDNILYCYSTDVFDSKEEYLKRYPGDKYVDILGFDDYKSIRSTETRNDLVKRLKIIDELAKEKNKVAVLSETGYETLSYNDWWMSVLLEGIKQSESDIAYLLVWRNARKDHHYAPYPGHGSVNSFLEFKNDPETFFLEDLPKMYQ